MIPTPSALAVRLVASALIRVRPKSHSTALRLSSISTFSYKRLVKDSTDDQQMTDIYRFEVAVNNFPRVQINETQRDVMELYLTRQK